ncbi:hypothetical protein L873DRAFT_1805787, partial [Choiromyces venosus 120613-1]
MLNCHCMNNSRQARLVSVFTKPVMIILCISISGSLNSYDKSKQCMNQTNGIDKGNFSKSSKMLIAFKNKIPLPRTLLVKQVAHERMVYQMRKAIYVAVLIPPTVFAFTSGFILASLIVLARPRVHADPSTVRWQASGVPDGLYTWQRLRAGEKLKDVCRHSHSQRCGCGSFHTTQ